MSKKIHPQEGRKEKMLSLTEQNTNEPSLRSSSKPFDFKTSSFVCEVIISTEKEKKKP